MAWKKTNDTYYGEIATAIRAKNGTNNTYTPSQMANAIGAISTMDALIERNSTSVTTNVTSVGNYAFYHYTGLTDINMPNVTRIGNNAFEGCGVILTQLPTGITYIGEYAFNECYNVALTSLPENLTEINQRTFRSCSNLAITKLPNGVTRINTAAFYGCRNIPFLDCSDFTHIPVLENSNAFGNSTFPFYFKDQTQLDSWASESNWAALASRFQIKPSEVI